MNQTDIRQLTAEIEKQIRSNLQLMKNDVNLEEKKDVLFTEILEEYQEGPITKTPMTSRIRDHNTKTNLGDIPAIKTKIFGVTVASKVLKHNYHDILVQDIFAIIRKFILDDEYKNGIVRNIKREISTLLTLKESQWNQTFDQNFQWEVHMYAIQLLQYVFELELVKRLFKARNQAICYIIPKVQ